MIDREIKSQDLAKKAMIIGYTRMLCRAVRPPNETDSSARIERCKEMLAVLLEKNLCF